jgi:hypothetical protein
MKNTWLIFFLFFLTSFSFPSIRSAKFAGSFYPGSSQALKREVTKFLNQVSKEKPSGKLIALIVPHAGYRFSGQTAAYAYKQLLGKKIKRVLLIGQSHIEGDFLGGSLGAYTAYETPLGKVKVLTEIAQRLLQKYEFFNFIPSVHTGRGFRGEHSLEVQLPFLQVVLQDFKIFPLILGRADYSLLKKIAQSLVKLLKGKDNWMVICSSDMYHGYSYSKAWEIDKVTLQYIKALNPEGLFKEARASGECYLCGLNGVIVTMLMAKELGANKVKVLYHTTSGDVTGEKSGYTVGYGAIGFYHQESQKKGAKRMGKELSKEAQKKLLQIARESILYYLRTGKILEPDISSFPELKEKRAVFVTLHKKGELRGCIGYIQAIMPLYQAVVKNAINAAVEDPRFPKVKEEEMSEIDIEISVLSPFKKIENLKEIEVGKHGLYLKKGFHSGLLLPQVATEYRWTREEFLAHTCLKAGLPQDAWRRGGIEISIFSAEVFGEKELLGY